MISGSSQSGAPASLSDASLVDTDGVLRETIDHSEGPAAYRAPPRTLGRYMLLDLLGEGGMGQVYRAYDPELDRMIAIKRLRVDDDDGPARLQREAQAIARLSHPHVVQVHDVGRDEATGDLFIAMELVDGDTLQQWLFAQPRSWRDIARVFAEAGRGLQAAHARGVVHRDFKPHNVLVTAAGHAKVVDFGLARPTGRPGDVLTPRDTGRTPRRAEPDGDEEREAPSRTITPHGARTGTPAYMPPEALVGDDPDPRGDQFSFAVALYEALAGKLPFAGRNAAEYSVAVLDGHPAPFPRGIPIPRRLQRAILRALSRQPGDRHHDLSPLLAELEREPIYRRRRFAFGGALVLGGGLAALASVWAPGRDTAATRCRSVAARVNEWWADGPRDTLHERLAAIAPPLGPETATRTTAALDELATQWSDARFDACMSGSVALVDSIDPRALCLEREAMRMRHLVSALQSADASTLDHAVPAVEAARHELERCREPAGLQRFERLLQADQAGAVRAAIETASRHRALGEAGAGLEVLDAVDVREVHGTVAFEVELLRARLHHAAGELQAAERAFGRATEVGLGQADPSAAAQWHLSWGDLLYERGRLEQMDPAYARAEQLMRAQLGARARDTVFASATRGHLSYATGDYKRALEIYEAAAASLSEITSDTDPLRMLVDEWVAGAQGHLGLLAEARRAQQDLVQRHEQAYGPSHTDTLERVYTLGVLELRAREPAAALTHFERVLATRKARGDTDAIDRAACEANIGAALLALGRHDHAFTKMRDALHTLTEAGLPRTHPNVLAARANLGVALQQQGRHTQAEPVLAEVLSHMEAAGVGSTANALVVRLELGRAHLAAGDATRALDTLEVGVDRASASGDTVLRGRLRLLLSRALDELGHRAAATGTLELARTDLSDLSDPGAARFLADLEAYARARSE